MSEYNPWQTVNIILVLAPLAVASWIGLLYLLFWAFGVKAREALDDITLPEAVFFAGWAFSSAYLVAAIYSRFL